MARCRGLIYVIYTYITFKYIYQTFKTPVDQARQLLFIAIL